MTKNYELGILNYKPDFQTSTAAFLEKYQDTLKSFEGSIIISIHVVWDLEHDEAFLDAPAIIQTDKGQIVLAATYLDHFSMTINNIDMNLPINWFDAPESEQYEWRCFRNYEGKNFEIKSAQVIEFSNGFDGDKFWCFAGLQFTGVDEVIIVGNGLDTLFFHFSNELKNKRVIPH